MTSVLTLVKGREIALENLLKGLSANQVMPDEVIIVFMNEPIRKLPSMPFPVRCFEIYAMETLPLSAARNLAAHKASGDFLIFLDVDCIPAVDLIGIYEQHQWSGQLLSGQIRYLGKEVMQDKYLLKNLHDLSIPDPIRSHLTEVPFELFWSLNFACSKLVYFHIGGFDEAYKGYGAEDTDFSFAAENKKLSIQGVQAFAYHQYHDSYSPPLNHFDDIISNAGRFFAKWGVWPMEGWLKAFEDRGLIEWRPTEIITIRFPDLYEIRQVLKR
ncbi:galactosyltransferase-related protein [Pedobacter sp. AW31-3R]|uniref:galactosyltransferase-related protein n=1 Tax=Pedobacter sp. AW31-3R TaxID=3445781 RepID=UPI003F9F15C4